MLAEVLSSPAADLVPLKAKIGIVLKACIKSVIIARMFI